MRISWCSIPTANSLWPKTDCTTGIRSLRIWEKLCAAWWRPPICEEILFLQEESFLVSLGDGNARRIRDARF